MKKSEVLNGVENPMKIEAPYVNKPENNEIRLISRVKINLDYL